MRRSYLIPFALIAVAALAEEEAEEAELATPDMIAFTMSDGSAGSKELESSLAKVRGAYEEKPVLFLHVNLATAGGKKQGEMLFFSLGVPQLWEECKKSPGHLVLASLEPVAVLSKHGPKENLAGALDKQLAGDGCEEGCEDGCGCDEGCGCDG